MINLQNLAVLHDTREYMLSPRNRVLLFVIWLRMYPTYTLLSNMLVLVGQNWRLCFLFAVRNEIIFLPGQRNRRSMQVIWTKLLMAVGAIDGTSHRIYIPEVEPQELYYLRHGHSLPSHSNCFWCVWDNTLHTFEWHFGLMRQLGTDLIFLEELCLLADKICYSTPVLTSYTSQLARRPLVERRTCRKFNSLIRKYRIRVEHAIADLKTYKYVGSLWRHPLDMLPSTVCASLVGRRSHRSYFMKLNVKLLTAQIPTIGYDPVQ